MTSAPTYRSCFQKTWDAISSDQACWSLIVLGIGLRLKVYLENNSFWLDEAWLALDISTRTFNDIISARPFSNDLLTVPPVFALIQKTTITLFGNNEYIFRLFPLLCGIAAIFLFYGLAKKYLGRHSVPIALIFFVCSDILIYQASQAKQYSSGVLVVLLLYHLMIYMDSLENVTMRDAIVYGIAGGLAVALFYPATFILAGIGTVQIIRAINSRDGERFRAVFLAAFLWLTTFLIIYYIYCYYMFQNGIMHPGSNPYPLASLSGLALSFDWLVREFLSKTVGLNPFFLGLYFLLAGFVSLFRKDKVAFFVFALPVCFVFIALLFGKYLMRPRFFLAFLPGVLMVFAYGVTVMMQNKKKIFVIFNGLLLGVLLFHPLRAAAYSLGHSHAIEEMRPLMKHLRQYRKPGDALICNNSAQYAYFYYLKYFQFEKYYRPYIKTSDIIERDESGRNLDASVFKENGNYLRVITVKEISRVSENTVEPFGENKRTWILLAHIRPDTKEFILSLLDRDGVPLKAFEQKGAFLYLYDLSGKSYDSLSN